MLAEIINIGDELLIGQTINTNGSWIGRKLNTMGIETLRSVSIADKKKDILNQLLESSTHANIVIITGGLGPTKDDITKNTLCEFFETKLIRNEVIENEIRLYFESKEREVLQVNLDQALLPENCSVLPNKLGTASGMWFLKNEVIYIALPGVPYEMRHLMEFQVIPRLSKFVKKSIFNRTIKTVGVGESFLADKLSVIENELRMEGLGLAYLPSPGTVKLRISMKGEDYEISRKLVSKYTEKIESLINEFIYGYDDDDLLEIIKELLINRKSKIGVSESCTGGYLSHLFTTKPGSSEYFTGGIVTYSDEMKQSLLGVRKSSLRNFGAVSEEVVKEMVEGGIKSMSCDYCIAISGIAGPTGATEEKPVGLVYIGIGSKTNVRIFRFQFGNTRLNNIKTSALYSLNEMRKFLMEEL